LSGCDLGSGGGGGWVGGWGGWGGRSGWSGSAAASGRRVQRTTKSIFLMKRNLIFCAQQILKY